MALVAFVAVVWLNQGIGLAAWKERQSRPPDASSAFDTARDPFLFLYRRAQDEEMYFATASAVFGEPYDPDVFAIRGDTPLPPTTVLADGRVHLPYAAVPFEYPPPNLPFVLLPRLASHSFEGYARVFGAIMGLLLALSAWLAARIASPHDERERARHLVGFALLLLAHGAIGIQRLDAIVSLLLMLVVRSAIRRDDRSFGFWAGLVGATKIVPIAVALAVLVASGVPSAKTKAGRKRLADVALGGAAGLGLGIVPMLLLSTDSFAMMLRYHGDRGLHVESSLGVLYGAAKALLGMHERAVLDYGSFNFHGGVADALAKVTPLLLCILIGAVIHAAYRRSLDDDVVVDETTRTTRIVVAALAASMALWLGSKVFSPQYLTWALPLTIALPGRAWRRVTIALGLILLLSQLYYRGYYDHVYNQWPLGIVTMVTRLGLLYALFLALVRWLGRGSATTTTTKTTTTSGWLLLP